jgi:hypothetical protein
MSSFCGGTGSIPAMTPSEIQQIYPSGILPATMPSMTNGLADEAWLKNYVNSLQQQGRIPTPPPANTYQSAPFDSPDKKSVLAEFSAKENKLQEDLKKEYCFYERRYFSALDSFLQAIADNSLRGQSATTVEGRLAVTVRLNQKVTLLTQITNAISKLRYSSGLVLQGDIDQVNQNLKARQERLIQQREILVKESAAADLHKRMVDYTTEKARANSNLLTLYGILNLTAVALIYYIARAA